MAEYYPLLAKAVSGLPNSTPETRSAVYERARKALLGQLRAVDPPVPEADIDRENDALDVAIARLEGELQPALAGSPNSPVNTPAPSKPPVAAAPVSPPPAAAPVAPVQFRPVEAAPVSTVRPRIEASPAPNLPLDEKKDEPKAAEIPISAPVKIRTEPQRPSAPQVPAPKQNPRGLWIVLSVIGLIVAGVAFAAWKLRDRPEDLAKAKSAQSQQQTEASGKIVGRVGEAEQPKTMGMAAGGAATQSASDAAASNVPVTYRAALLVQAPEEKTKIKTFVGTVIWRLDNVSNGPGEPLGTAVHATVDIPEDKLQVSMTLQKNIDASLPATHTMTIVFTVQPSTPTGVIKQIGVPQMRKEDSASGESLIGLPVPIMENSFLIGLAKGTAESSNLDLLKTRQWIDIPMLLSDGRIAKLTFEKGVAGLRATEDAIASWQAQ